MFKMDKNILIVLIMSISLLFGLTIGKIHAFSSQGVDITIHEDGTYSQDNSTDEVHFHQESNFESYNTYLMFEDGTKLTYRYLLDNPDFSITFTNMSESGGSLIFKSSDINCLGFKTGTITSGQSITLSSESKIKYHNYATSKTLSEWFADRSSELETYLDLPVVVFSNNVNNPWDLEIEGMSTPIEILMNNIRQLFVGILSFVQQSTDFITSQGLLLFSVLVSLCCMIFKIIIKQRG